MGKGSLKEGGTTLCTGCSGRGVKVQIRQLGPGMIQQLQSVCPDCQGKGEMIAEKDRCPECQGKKVIPETTIQEFTVERGMEWGEALVKGGEGDQQPGVEPGDLVVVLQEKPDKDEYFQKFKRNGNDLIFAHELTLNEALTGFKFNIKQLDGRNLCVTSNGDVVKPGDVFMVDNEGMPKEGNPNVKGRLFIRFDVIFPHYKQIAKNVKELKSILPAPAPQKPVGKDEMIEDVDPKRVDFEQEKKKSRKKGSSDDDERGGQQQCMHSIM